MSQARCLEHLCRRWLLFGNQTHPSHTQVRDCPGVLEGSASGGATHWGGVVLVGVEERVEVDEVNALTTHAPHEGQVAPVQLVLSAKFGTPLAISTTLGKNPAYGERQPGLECRQYVGIWLFSGFFLVTM